MYYKFIDTHKREKMNIVITPTQTLFVVFIVSCIRCSHQKSLKVLNT